VGRLAPLFVLLILLALPPRAGMAEAGAAIDIQYACSPAPRDCSGWYRTPVTVTWSLNPRPEEGSVIVAGCTPQTISADTAGMLTWCEAAFGTDQARRTKVVAVDQTPPNVIGAAPERPADANGWYHQAVPVAFRGSDAISGIRSCTSTSYTGPDSATASVLGTCTDAAGNTSAAAPFTLQYDATGPDITDAVAARKPDRAGWYNRPVAWSFKATDALSGLDQCPPVRVAGGTGAMTLFAGTCSDRAGNVASRVFSLPYDATAPAAPQVATAAGDRRVQLSVSATADTAVLRISRMPGLKGARRSTLYEGPPAGLTDRRVGNRRHYRYVVTAIDEAGNASRRLVRVTPGPHLLAPRGGAGVTAPPLLEWTRVHRATYYNVQLFRGHRKLLSAWPSSASHQLRPDWRFAGHARRLTPGRYRWYVWPGFGPRSERRFGRLVGRRSFVVAGR
jgi:hypothetical protein